MQETRQTSQDNKNYSVLVVLFVAAAAFSAVADAAMLRDDVDDDLVVTSSIMVLENSADRSVAEAACKVSSMRALISNST